MTTLSAPTDVLAESQRLIATLERLREEVPLAEDALAIQRPTHQDLERSHSKSALAVGAWREALAHRWECEVAGRRIYKQIIRQIAEHYGGVEAPEVQALTRGEAEANSTPAELLTDLRRLQAALSIGHETLSFVRVRLPELEQACVELETAITEANLRETERRVAVLDGRIASEAYRRARSETRRMLTAHFGERLPGLLDELLG